MNKMVLFLASLLLYSLSSAAQSRETKVIDFRYQQISQSEPQTVGGSIQTLPGHEGPRVTETLVLKISDLMITQGSESAADYKLQIMNNGSQPVAVPITQELASLYAPEELTQVDFDCLSFSFTWDSAKEGARNLPAAIVLYGRKDRPWSFLNLQPGYWVTIRGRVNLPSQPTKQEGNLQANALFAVMKYLPTPKGLVLDWTIIKDLQSDKSRVAGYKVIFLWLPQETTWQCGDRRNVPEPESLQLRSTEGLTSTEIPATPASSQ